MHVSAMEDVSRTRQSCSKRSGKMSQKASKKQVHFDTMENEDVDCLHEASDLDDTVLNIAGVVGCAPTERSTKRQKKQVQPSIGEENGSSSKKKRLQHSSEELDDNVRDRRSKQRRQASSAPDTIITEDGNITKVQETVHETEGQEPNVPTDSSWVQRASWKSLVGETGRVAFSVGGLFGQNTSGNTRVAMEGLGEHAKRSNVSAWIDGESRFVPSSGSHSDQPKVSQGNNFITKLQTKRNPQPVTLQGVGNCTFEVGDADVASSTCHIVENPDLKKVLQNEDNGGESVCTFMRSDSYEQEWLEAKRAVKDIYKRSRKDAIRSMKMFHTKQKT